ncbi:hypothetical protein [Janthinobacterium sp. PSPC3-1]|uniref:hypothetical protein n=1 Tax=Janthinobacterium sp. PSPC3-1 TaxID=2804653 RepID=UPI003CF711A0
MRAQNHLLRQLLQPSLPLLVWGVHFFFCYIVAAEQGRFGQASLSWTVGIASLLALALLTVLCWRAVRRLHAGGAISMLDWASAACAVLGMIGVLLTCLPLVLLRY